VSERGTEYLIMDACQLCLAIPLQGLLPVDGALALSIRAPVHALMKADIPRLGIAGLARRRDFGTADPRIEGVVRPVNVRHCAHSLEIVQCLNFCPWGKHLVSCS